MLDLEVVPERSLGNEQWEFTLGKCVCVCVCAGPGGVSGGVRVPPDPEGS